MNTARTVPPNFYWMLKYCHQQLIPVLQPCLAGIIPFPDAFDISP